MKFGDSAIAVVGMTQSKDEYQFIVAIQLNNSRLLYSLGGLNHDLFKAPK